MRKIYQLHKWLSLVFSFPLLVITFTGLMLAIKPEAKKEVFSLKGKIQSVAQILQDQKALRPKSHFLRAMYNDESVSILLKENDVRMVKVALDGEVLSDTRIMDDFFVMNKIIHESLLLQKFGKNIVAISGLGLFLILLSGFIFWMRNNFWREFKKIFNRGSFKRLKKFHVFIGVLFILPIMFSSLSGVLIEYHYLFFSDRNPISHIRPKTCEWGDQLQVISEFSTEGRGMIMFCRPDFPYLTISDRRGSYQLTPEGKEVLFVPKEDWKGQFGARKHWFVHWHSGENFGFLRYPYLYMSSLPLLILIISGIIIWLKKKRRTHI